MPVFMTELFLAKTPRGMEYIAADHVREKNPDAEVSVRPGGFLGLLIVKGVGKEDLIDIPEIERIIPVSIVCKADIDEIISKAEEIVQIAGKFDTFADLTSTNDDYDETDNNSTGTAIRDWDGNNAGTANYNPHRQWELYLISPDGEKKTILRRTGNGIDDDNADGDNDLTTGVDEDTHTDFSDGNDGNEVLGLLQLIENGNNDTTGLPNPFINADGFPICGTTGNDCDVSKFINISPQELRIVDLRFYIFPLDDPRKAYAESSRDIQVQPHVTVVLKTLPSQRLLTQISPNALSTIKPIELQTTISTRVLHNVIFPQ